jgi:hypothetical protein
MNVLLSTSTVLEASAVMRSLAATLKLIVAPLGAMIGIGGDWKRSMAVKGQSKVRTSPSTLVEHLLAVTWVMGNRDHAKQTSERDMSTSPPSEGGRMMHRDGRAIQGSRSISPARAGSGR